MKRLAFTLTTIVLILGSLPSFAKGSKPIAEYDIADFQQALSYFQCKKEATQRAEYFLEGAVEIDDTYLQGLNPDDQFEALDRINDQLDEALDVFQDLYEARLAEEPEEELPPALSKEEARKQFRNRVRESLRKAGTEFNHRMRHNEYPYRISNRTFAKEEALEQFRNRVRESLHKLQIDRNHREDRIRQGFESTNTASVEYQLHTVNAGLNRAGITDEQRQLSLASWATQKFLYLLEGDCGNLP